jgi:uncharacterized protein YecT (DUF1311 family)
MKRIAWIFLGWLVLLTSAQAASFDCGKAATKVENLICSSSYISKLDDDLAKVFQEAIHKANEEQKQRLVNEQKNWLKQSRNICIVEPCFEQAYTSRMEALAKFFTAETPTHRGDWTYRDGAGKNKPLCHDLLRRLNRYDKDESLDNRCSFPVLASYNKFTAPPWEELDLKKYEELFVKLMKYSGEDPVRYFHLRPGLEQRNTESYYRAQTKRIIAEGGRLRMWRTRLVNNYGTAPIIPAPPGEQAIVQMFIPMPKENQTTYCIDKPKPANVNSLELLFIVTTDLSGPDPNVDLGTFGILGGRDLVIYEGKPLLVSSEDIWQYGELMVDRLCYFEFVQGRLKIQ